MLKQLWSRPSQLGNAISYFEHWLQPHHLTDQYWHHDISREFKSWRRSCIYRRSIHTVTSAQSIQMLGEIMYVWRAHHHDISGVHLNAWCDNILRVHWGHDIIGVHSNTVWDHIYPEGTSFVVVFYLFPCSGLLCLFFFVLFWSALSTAVWFTTLYIMYSSPSHFHL